MLDLDLHDRSRTNRVFGSDTVTRHSRILPAVAGSVND
jgi:hypothetical protein